MNPAHGATAGAASGAASADAIRRARVFWEQSRADLREARRRMRARAYLDSSFLSFQASLNALTSVCHLHGEYRVPNFSTARLAALLQGVDAHFERVQAPALALEAVQELNPYAPERDEAQERRQSREHYDHSDSILKAVRGYLKTHRRRFFAP
jgi:HEPN domain-containing protein